MLVVNLFGGPGTGKSTTAAGTFALLKHMALRTELVTEYAKDLVYDEHTHTLYNQLKVFAEQQHRLWRLDGKVDIVVTDSPLLLNLVYGDGGSLTLRSLVREEHGRWPSLNVFLHRQDEKVYQPYGRLQTEAEAHVLDSRIRGMLDRNSYEYTAVPADVAAPQVIVDIISRDYVHSISVATR